MLTTLYLFYRFLFINTSVSLIIPSVILFLAEFHTIIHLYGMLYSLWPRKYPVYLHFNTNRNLQINVFICVCGEPTDIVRETIIAAQQTVRRYITYVRPFKKPRVIVLNDGFVARKENFREIERIAHELGALHIMRTKPGGYKAGNINNGLKQFPTSDPHNTVDVFFDADFCAKEEFLMEILKPLRNDRIDFVQSPQRYKNEVNWVAKGAAAHQIFFFDYICPAKAYDNALFLCGTNYAIRRSALLSVKGVDPRFITEDYATSISMHLAGKRGVFIPTVLALGMSPANLKQYFNQQYRWSKGSFDVSRVFLKEILFGPLTLKQKYHYLLSATYYLIGIRNLILMIAPIPYLFFGVSLIKATTIQFVLFVYTPLVVYNFLHYSLSFKHPLKSLILDVVAFPVFVSSFFSSVLCRKSAFVVTIKKYEPENFLRVFKVQIILAIFLIAGLIYGFRPAFFYDHGWLINYFWAAVNTFLLSVAFIFSFFENNLLRWSHVLEKIRFLFTKPAYLTIVGLVVIFLSATMINNFASAQQSSVAFQKPSFELVSEKDLLVPTSGAYYGYYLPKLNVHPYNIRAIFNTNEETSLAMYYQDWASGGLFNKRFIELLETQGVVPVITWEPYDSKKPPADFEAQKNYTPKLIADGIYDWYIRRFAKEAASYNKPVFLRFAHEMNGNWYPWGNIGDNTPTHYRQMWRHVYNLFRQEGAHNVLFVWAPNNTDENGNSENLLDYYPGDKYVDWIGFSGFNWGTVNTKTRWVSFKELAYEIYYHLSRLNKPIMVAETSSVSMGGDKSEWLIQTLTQDLPSFPKIKAIVLFNQDFGKADFNLNQHQQLLSSLLKDNHFYIKKPIFVYREYQKSKLLGKTFTTHY